METALTDVEKEQIRAQIIQQLAKVDEALAHQKSSYLLHYTGRTKKKTRLRCASMRLMTQLLPRGLRLTPPARRSG